MSPAKYQNYSEISVNSAPERHLAASSGENKSEPCTPIGSQLTQVRSGLVHDLDCALRRSSDDTRRMQLALRMGMEREGSTPAFKARQDAILRRDNRIRVRAITA
jgi:hypothetical protein